MFRRQVSNITHTMFLWKGSADLTLGSHNREVSSDICNFYLVFKQDSAWPRFNWPQQHQQHVQILTVISKNPDLIVLLPVATWRRKTELRFTWLHWFASNLSCILHNIKFEHPSAVHPPPPGTPPPSKVLPTPSAPLDKAMYLINGLTVN